MENGNSFSTSLPWWSFKAGFRLTGLAEGSRCRRPEWANHIGSMPGHHSGHSRMEKSFRSRRPVLAVKPVPIIRRTGIHEIKAAATGVEFVFPAQAVNGWRRLDFWLMVNWHPPRHI